MERHRWMSVVLVFSLSLNFAFIAVWVYHVSYVRPLLRERAAQQSQAGPSQTGAGCEWLNLREDQARKLTALKRDVRPGIMQLRRDAEEAQDRYLQLLAEPNPDPEAVQQALEQIATLQAGFRRNAFRGLKRFHDMLDPEQQAQLRGRLRPQRQGQGGRPANMRDRPGPGMRPRRGPERELQRSPF